MKFGSLFREFLDLINDSFSKNVSIFFYTKFRFKISQVHWIQVGIVLQRILCFFKENFQWCIEAAIEAVQKNDLKSIPLRDERKVNIEISQYGTTNKCLYVSYLLYRLNKRPLELIIVAVCHYQATLARNKTNNHLVMPRNAHLAGK